MSIIVTLLLTVKILKFYFECNFLCYISRINRTNLLYKLMERIRSAIIIVFLIS